MTHSAIKLNEAKYGVELRATYGNDVIDLANARYASHCPQSHDEQEQRGHRVIEAFIEAFNEGAGDPASSLAMNACELHKQWLLFYWDPTMYSAQAHAGLGELYVADERFVAFYDQHAPGLSKFIRDALQQFCQ